MRLEEDVTEMLEDSYGPSLFTMSSIRMLEYASALEAIIGGTRAFES